MRGYVYVIPSAGPLTLGVVAQSATVPGLAEAEVQLLSVPWNLSKFLSVIGRQVHDEISTPAIRHHLRASGFDESAKASTWVQSTRARFLPAYHGYTTCADSSLMFVSWTANPADSGDNRRNMTTLILT
ncbi:hypothetical protein BDN72DRAFT_839119 [Pluteus cervinus]|uniref:Uncharacterized protein n=1 Tax=Pluteus cervinus TaxID=181527 RepID=A0ACD3AYG0_9AGAR|nr:hypothetical protein BDN72DRAFT_839119 [Pluteus cervinus]